MRNKIFDDACEVVVIITLSFKTIIKNQLGYSRILVAEWLARIG
jgi:hypothetical protein